MKVARLVFALALVSFLAGSVLAQDSTDQPNRRPGGGGRGRGQGGFGGGDAAAMFDRFTAAVEKLDLTSGEKEKFEPLKKDYAPKFKAIQEKADKIRTEDQKAAIKKLREAKPEERRALYQQLSDKLKMTDDQRKAMEPVAKEGRSLMEEARSKVLESLTDEHKAKLRELMGRRGGGGRPPRGGNGAGGADQSQRNI